MGVRHHHAAQASDAPRSLWRFTGIPALWRQYLRLQQRFLYLAAPGFESVEDERNASEAMEKMLDLLEKRGHRALGLPTPPRGRAARVRWLTRIARQRCSRKAP